MRFTEIISESAGYRLKDLAKISTNMPDADFWLIRKGSDKTVGKPVKEFDPSRIGIKVVRTDVLNPNYLYYVMMNLHNQGQFARIANGTTNLVNIRVEDIANIPLGQQGVAEGLTPPNEFLSKAERLKAGDKVFYKGKLIGIATGEMDGDKVLFNPIESYGKYINIGSLPIDQISLREGTVSPLNQQSLVDDLLKKHGWAVGRIEGDLAFTWEGKSYRFQGERMRITSPNGQSMTVVWDKQPNWQGRSGECSFAQAVQNKYITFDLPIWQELNSGKINDSQAIQKFKSENERQAIEALNKGIHK